MMRIHVVAAAMMPACIKQRGVPRYPEECCHDRDCHPVPCGEIEKIRQPIVARQATKKTTPIAPNTPAHSKCGQGAMYGCGDVEQR
jgi:hypothetical protein